MIKVSIEISARHIHLSKKDLEVLFGKGYKLNKKKDLTQPGMFAAEETLTIQKNNKKITKVRIVGPIRSKTQVELSLTDAYNLGIKIPIRKSGVLKGTPGIMLIGPKKKLKIKQGVICAWRHIHLSNKEAKKFKLEKQNFVSVKVKGTRSVIFSNVRIRINKNYRLCLHIDTDEGNAANISKKGTCLII